MNLMAASNQWATRPLDERFWNLRDLIKNLEGECDYVAEATANLEDVQVAASDESNEVYLTSKHGGNRARFSNWSFQQFSTLCQAPAAFLRTVNPRTAASCLNDRLGKIEPTQQRLLLRRNGDTLVRAVTGTGYGRIWNLDLARKLLPALELGWVTPPARPAVKDPRARRATVNDILPDQDSFGLSVKVGDMIAPAGVYCGDRDMFVFLVNPNRVVDDGGKGLMRGVFVWNSEVGAGAFKVKAFMLEHVCGNVRRCAA